MKYVITAMLLWTLAAGAAAQTVIQIEALGATITTNESRYPNLAGDDMAEFADVFSYDWSILADIDSSTGLPSSRTRIAPIRFVKPIGASSVSLRRAIDEAQVVNVEFRVYVPTEEADGTDTLLYQVTGSNGRVVALRPFFASGSGPVQALEEVGIAFPVLEFEHVPSGAVSVIQQ